MISQDELIKQISNTIGKTKVLELSRILKEQAFALRDLIDLAYRALAIDGPALASDAPSD